MLNKPQYSLKHEQLLRDLKTTIDGLLSTQAANVWSIYGGLNRLHSLLDKIFRHGYKIHNFDQSYLDFIQGLEWLQPSTSTNYFTVDCEYHSHIPNHLKNNRASIWLYRSLENLTLSTKLGWLLSDKNHVNTCYYPYAFFCNEDYGEATLICLKALERNQPSLMSEINPRLFLLQPNAKDLEKIHRRCSSFPDKYLKHVDEAKGKKRILGNDKSYKPVTKCLGKLKPWSSTPNLYLEKMDIIKEIVQSKTVPNTPVHNKRQPALLPSKRCTFFKQSSNKTTNVRNKVPIIVDNRNIIEHTPPFGSSLSSDATIGDKSNLDDAKFSFDYSRSPRSVVDYSFSALQGEKDYTKAPKKSFIEDGGKTILPMSTGYFPKPEKGQTLMSFLISSQLSGTHAELDRENAHFSISEAIISALEQIRCKRASKISDENLDDSDPEILDLKQRIRIRRRQKMVEKQRRVWAFSMASSGRNLSTTSVSPSSTTPETFSECSSSDNIDDVEIDEASNLLESKGLSISMASLYSESDFKKMRGVPDGASDVFSAESVAISLISKFKEKQLPKASELEWLVSEEDAPQALLPLPTSWPVSPDDSESISVPLRGTRDWAPPRPQIIFTLHSPATRKQLMLKQNYRCAGCSMRVAPQYASKFRYCEYLGRYFCTGCHSNQLAFIPARILQKWDFSRYPVSSFSYRLLEQMYSDPLFRIFELNKNIGKIAKDLEFCRRYNLGLFYMKDFIYSCKSAEEIKKILMPHVKKFVAEIEIFSIDDLVKIKSGEMKNKLKYLVDLCVCHISNCQICIGRGHICEVCKSNEVIFPWQMRLTSRCDKCGTCYHKNCWKSGIDTCKKCARLGERRKSDFSLTSEDCI